MHLHWLLSGYFINVLKPFLFRCYISKDNTKTKYSPEGLLRMIRQFKKMIGAVFFFLYLRVFLCSYIYTPFVKQQNSGKMVLHQIFYRTIILKAL